ncbi:MAG: hypothetical protein E6K82_03820 [Candidatus Rokuibacteriota bacterium]|nr:MAG: hypothetical protein E6K82_03820 [Candidatus Rokubacteria bacterium]
MTAPATPASSATTGARGAGGAPEARRAGHEERDVPRDRPRQSTDQRGAREDAEHRGELERRQRGRQPATGAVTQDRGEPGQRRQRMPGAQQRAADEQRGEAAAAGEQRGAGQQEERHQPQGARQMMRDEEADRHVGQHPGESERARHGAELPVGQPSRCADLRQQRRKGADRDRGRPEDEAEDHQKASCWHIVCNVGLRSHKRRCPCPREV